MVDFRFDIKPLFPQPIIKVTSNLLPHTFRGDRRQCLDATSKMSEIIDRLGQLSAVSQGLNKPVTTAQRLRMSDNQIIYLLADCNAGQNGAVTGLLKVGTKDLYLFDEAGQTRKVESAPSILDFYVHESRQRAGLGKHLFETMLSEEQWTPLKCSVDRPSEKLLGFLRKHYGLVKTIPQANNFVLYEGYFDNVSNAGDSNKRQSNGSGLHITNSPNTQLFGAAYVSDDANKRRSVGGQQQQQASQNVLLQQITQISPVGRYGAPRPTCSMAEIIHAGSPKANKGGAESSSVIDIEALMQQHRLHDNDPAAGLAKEEIVEPFPEPEPSPVMRTQVTRTPSPPEEQRQQQAEVDNIISTTRRPPTFQLSKQHTGMKNRSFGVGMAVTPTDKMEFDHEVPEDFGVVKINRHAGKLTSPVGGGAGNGADNADAVSTVSSGEGLTDQGYYDLKFYHNKLW